MIKNNTMKNELVYIIDDAKKVSMQSYHLRLEIKTSFYLDRSMSFTFEINLLLITFLHNKKYMVRVYSDLSLHIPSIQ